MFSADIVRSRLFASYISGSNSSWALLNISSCIFPQSQCKEVPYFGMIVASLTSLGGEEHLRKALRGQYPLQLPVVVQSPVIEDGLDQRFVTDIALLPFGRIPEHVAVRVYESFSRHGNTDLSSFRRILYHNFPTAAVLGSTRRPVVYQNRQFTSGRIQLPSM